MAPPSLLSLPPKIRLQIYRYLVPTALLESSPLGHRMFSSTSYNLSLICRQMKTEYEHEAVKDIKEYFKQRGLKCFWRYHEMRLLDLYKDMTGRPLKLSKDRNYPFSP